MSVVCTGNIVIDILTRPVEEIVWGGTRWVESIEQSLGGNGANTSAALAKLGIDVTLIGAVGKDAFGDAALARLTECSVRTHRIERLDTATATTVALVRPGGVQAFLHQPGVSRVVFASPIELEPAKRFHLGNPFSIVNLRRQAPAVLRQAKARGMLTSLDTAWDALGEWMKIVGPCLPHTDLLFSNEDEVRMLTGIQDPLLAAAQLHRKGSCRVVLKLGPRGCMLFGPEGEQHVPGFEVEAIDTTGAGDCFAGGFLAALERGLSYTEAARIANAVGALNVQSLGATSGLRTWDETLTWMSGARVRCD